MINLGLKCRSYKEIQRIAEDSLRSYCLYENIPVPIEELLDVTLGLNLVPYPNLSRTREINSCLSNNLKRIFVDDYLFYNLEKPLRFTLAHELGHIVLHSDIYAKFKPVAKEDWTDFLINIHEIDRVILENEADDFAGLFLVPEKHLEPLFVKFVDEKKDWFIEKGKGSPKHIIVGAFKKYIAEQLSEVLNVSPKVVEIRINKNGMEGYLFKIVTEKKS